MSILPGPLRTLKLIKKGPWQAFKRNWFAIEAIPLYFVTGGTVAFGLATLAWEGGMSPEVVWTRRNPAPYTTIDQDETPKIGVALGPRLDAAGYPQKPYRKRWNRMEKYRTRAGLSYEL